MALCVISFTVQDFGAVVVTGARASLEIVDLPSGDGSGFYPRWSEEQTATSGGLVTFSGVPQGCNVRVVCRACDLDETFTCPAAATYTITPGSPGPRVRAIVVAESDGDPSVESVSKIVVPAGSLTDDGGGQVTLAFGGTVPTVTVTEEDGSPSVLVGTIKFPNDSLTNPSSGVGSVSLVIPQTLAANVRNFRITSATPTLSGSGLTRTLSSGYALVNGKRVAYGGSIVLTANKGGGIGLDLNDDGTITQTYGAGSGDPAAACASTRTRLLLVYTGASDVTTTIDSALSEAALVQRARRWRDFFRIAQSLEITGNAGGTGTTSMIGAYRQAASGKVDWYFVNQGLKFFVRQLGPKKLRVYLDKFTSLLTTGETFNWRISNYLEASANSTSFYPQGRTDDYVGSAIARDPADSSTTKFDRASGTWGANEMVGQWCCFYASGSDPGTYVAQTWVRVTANTTTQITATVPVGANRVRFEGVRSDSDDSYAASFLSLVKAFYLAYPDDCAAWLAETNAVHAVANRAVLSSMATANLALRAFDATPDATWNPAGAYNGLVKTFQDDYNPTGYGRIAQCMDNAEAERGLRDWAWVLYRIGESYDAEYYLGFADQIGAGLGSLFVTTSGGNTYNAFVTNSVEKTAGTVPGTLFYPNFTANVWPSLFESKVDRTYREYASNWAEYNVVPNWDTDRPDFSPWIALATWSYARGDRAKADRMLAQAVLYNDPDNLGRYTMQDLGFWQHLQDLYWPDDQHDPAVLSPRAANLGDFRGRAGLIAPGVALRSGRGYRTHNQYIGPPNSAINAGIAASANNTVLNGHALTGAVQELRTGLTQPGIGRNLIVRASAAGDGTFATWVVEIGGTFRGRPVHEWIPGNAGADVAGKKAFDTIQYARVPAGAGTVSIGCGLDFGLEYPIKSAALCALEFARKASAATAYTIETLPTLNVGEAETYTTVALIGSDTTLTVANGDDFAAVGSVAARIFLELIHPDGRVEEAICTAHTGNAETFTIVRGTNGTHAIALPAGSRVRLKSPQTITTTITANDRLTLSYLTDVI